MCKYDHFRFKKSLADKTIAKATKLYSFYSGLCCFLVLHIRYIIVSLLSTNIQNNICDPGKNNESAITLLMNEKQVDIFFKTTLNNDSEKSFMR